MRDDDEADELAKRDEHTRHFESLNQKMLEMF
jgi:hypothetical protein